MKYPTINIKALAVSLLALGLAQATVACHADGLLPALEEKLPVTTAPAPAKSPNLLEAKISASSFTSRPYLLGPNDIISITFPMVPELDKELIRILPDGKVDLPIIGSVNAAGLTTEQLKDDIAPKYKDYLKNPKFSINVVEFKPFIVHITGAVLNPGVYELRSDTVHQTAAATGANNTGTMKTEVTVMRNTPLLTNILVAAGGVLYNADNEHVKINNTITGQTMEINLLDLLKTPGSSQDVYLSAGDTIYVPAVDSPLAINEEKYKLVANSTFAQRRVPVKVYGSVNRPGLIELDASQSLNINSAIMSAGGYLIANNYPTYPAKKVYLSRPDSNGQLATVAVDPSKNDITIMPNDIIYVPEKTIPRIGKAFDFLTRMVAPAGVIAGSYNNWALLADPMRYQVRPR